MMFLPTYDQDFGPILISVNYAVTAVVMLYRSQRHYNWLKTKANNPRAETAMSVL